MLYMGKSFLTFGLVENSWILIAVCAFGSDTLFRLKSLRKSRLTHGKEKGSLFLLVLGVLEVDLVHSWPWQCPVVCK
jgi:hypothetical protein